MTTSRESAALHPPEPVVAIARTLQEAGYAAWCVGGAVRDAILGAAHLDWDLATSAEPAVVRRLFKRTIPVGIEFGTVGVVDRDGRMHEVTTFRRDITTDGRHAVVEFGASLDEDLARRDFTMNSIAYDPIARRLHDPFDGRIDLQARVVRAVGDPRARMTEDRLRALRAIRFAARFDFEIDGPTWLAILESAPFLSRLSPERVKQELEKTMEQVARPSRALQRWRDSGAFAELVPALVAVTDATLAVVDCLPKAGLNTRPMRKVLRFAALFSEGDGKTSEQALRALRFSKQDIAAVSTLTAYWHKSGSALSATLATGNGFSDERLRRLAADIGRLRVAGFARLAVACWWSRGTASGADMRLLYRRILKIAFHDAIELADLVIDGDDLRSAQIVSGPLLGDVLRRLLDDVVQDPRLNQRDGLLRRARQYAASGAAPVKPEAGFGTPPT